MKRRLLLLLLLLLLPATLVQAQTAVTLETLEVQLWPDYDQESVLVLLTGTLPASTPLPATLTLPLPTGADFNVVARITADDVMTDEGMTPQVGANQVTFTLPDSRFRVEYYQPYSASDTQRAFTFSWQSEVAVEQLQVTLQQPFAATNVTTVPPATTVSEGQDGLTYHVLPSQTVAAGDTYTAEIGYTMNNPALTVSFLAQGSTSEELPVLDAVPVEETETESNWQFWLIGLGALILVGTAVWYFLSNRSDNSRPSRPKPVRQSAATTNKTSKAAVNFCHQCGEALTSGDKFCRSCGTAVKNK